MRKNKNPKIYTKQGDSGNTSLFMGGVVSKSHLRIATCGGLDNAVSAIGLARSLSRDSGIKKLLLEVQHDLFTISAEISSVKDLSLNEGSILTIEELHVEKIEKKLDELGSKIDISREFVLPGGSPGSAAIDLSRALVRSSERQIVEFHESGELKNQKILKYINRLSDLLFILARLEDHLNDLQEITTSDSKRKKIIEE
tara:strand:- start:8646 stop:9242 length:597 start_codon:yes stop_codon:yes gene_type:complete